MSTERCPDRREGRRGKVEDAPQIQRALLCSSCSCTTCRMPMLPCRLYSQTNALVGSMKPVLPATLYAPMKSMQPEKREDPMDPSPPASKGMERSAPMMVIVRSATPGVECAQRRPRLHCNALSDPPPRAPKR